MLANHPPTVKREEVCPISVADVSSRVASVSIAVKPDAGLVVRKEIIVADGKPVSAIAIVSVNARRKPQPTRYAVLRGTRSLSLQSEPDTEPRTRVIDSGPSFGHARIGFAKLKR
jgi:hypothetical protein